MPEVGVFAVIGVVASSKSLGWNSYPTGVLTELMLLVGAWLPFLSVSSGIVGTGLGAGGFPASPLLNENRDVRLARKPPMLLPQVARLGRTVEAVPALLVSAVVMGGAALTDEVVEMVDL